MIKNKNNKFICLVGIDGSGKTTQSILLCNRFNSIGKKSIYIRPRYEILKYFPLLLKNIFLRFLSIRNSLVKESTNHHSEKYSIKKILFYYILLLYVKITYNLFIRTYLKKHMVISDRYFFDWFQNIDKVKNEQLMSKIPMPDYCIFLDIDPNDAKKRMSSEEDKNIDIEYFTNLRNYYLYLSKKHGFIKINSNGITETNDFIFNCVNRYISCDNHDK